MSHHLNEFVQEFFPDSTITTGYHPKSARPRILPRKRVPVRRVPRRVPRKSDEVYKGANRARQLEKQKKKTTLREKPILYQNEKMLRARQLEQQKKSALRENPKLFQKETMLYVDAVINGSKMPLFVDTGAQASVMSMKTCRSLGLENSVDTSQAGIAAGVGFTRIYGKLWHIPVQIGRTKFHMQFNILDMGVNVILGLDQMKRLGMSINLRRHGLQIGHSFVPFTKPPKEEINLDCDMNNCVVM